MPPELTPHFPERDRELQSRLAVIWPHKDLAAAARMKPQSISAIACAINPLTLFRGFQFAQIQNDYRLLVFLAERAGAILLPNKPHVLGWVTMQLITSLALSFSRFFEIAQKINTGEPLTSEEMQQLDEDGEQMKLTIDSLRQQAHERRREQAEETKDKD